MGPTYEETFATLVAAIRKIVSDPAADITPDTTVKDLNFDSLDMAELAMELESRFDVGSLDANKLVKQGCRRTCFSEAPGLTMGEVAQKVLERRLERIPT